MLHGLEDVKEGSLILGGEASSSALAWRITNSQAFLDLSYCLQLLYSNFLFSLSPHKNETSSKTCLLLSSLSSSLVSIRACLSHFPVHWGKMPQIYKSKTFIVAQHFYFIVGWLQGRKEWWTAWVKESDLEVESEGRSWEGVCILPGHGHSDPPLWNKPNFLRASQL